MMNIIMELNTHTQAGQIYTITVHSQLMVVVVVVMVMMVRVQKTLNLKQTTSNPFFNIFD